MIVVAVTLMLFTEISFPPFPETLDPVAEPTPGLNCQPLGAVRINVLLLALAKSPFAPS